MSAREEPFVFACAGETLLGIVSRGAVDRDTAVLVIVGGPQYRVGSHRQFVLLARALAAADIPVMRFDYRGMGDSTGEPRSFEDIGDDIAAAVDAVCARVAGVRRVVLWGLCDAATAALFYAWRDPRIAAVVLLNPWVRTEAGVARAYLRGYYVRRLVDPQLWSRMVRGELDVRAAAASLASLVRRATARGAPPAEKTDAPPPLPERLAQALDRFGGKGLVILSGNDLTANEFRAAAAGDGRWRRAQTDGRVAWIELPEADHTFSMRAWRDEVAQATMDFVLALGRERG